MEGTLKPSEIRTKSAKEIMLLIAEKEEAFFNLKLKLKTGQLAKTADVGKAKREIARMKTIVNQKSKEKVN